MSKETIDQYQCVLNQLYSDLNKKTENFLGYPVSKDFQYESLFEFFRFPMNNLGDPFSESTYEVGSKELEREVVEFFAGLFRAPKDNWWGYVTNGGSEGNLYGLYLAREIYPKAIVYHSMSTHYSVQKNIHLLNMSSIVVRTNRFGEMDYEDLKFNISMNRSHPVIILANIGTTMTEARDDLQRIRQVLKDCAIQNHYIHSDGALSGSYSAFLDPRPAFDFADGCDSIAISGHKFIGSPIPSGVVVVKKSNRDRIARSISYIGSMDTTITGSRNGHSPLFLWHSIKRLGLDGFRKRAEHSLRIAEYTVSRMNQAGIPAWKNTNAITVVFPTPHKEVCNKWQLATEDSVSHIVCMPNVTEAHINSLIDSICEYNLKSDILSEMCQ